MIIEQRHQKRRARFRLARNKTGALIEWQSVHGHQSVIEFIATQ